MNTLYLFPPSCCLFNNSVSRLFADNKKFWELSKVEESLLHSSTSGSSLITIVGSMIISEYFGFPNKSSYSCFRLFAYRTESVSSPFNSVCNLAPILDRKSVDASGLLTGGCKVIKSDYNETIVFHKIFNAEINHYIN